MYTSSSHTHPLQKACYGFGALAQSAGLVVGLAAAFEQLGGALLGEQIADDGDGAAGTLLVADGGICVFSRWY